MRTSFVAARDQAQRAFNAAINGDAEEADDKALSATAAAVDAQARLKRMPAQLQSGDVARALLDSYDHIRLAATAVRGGPDGDNYSPSTAQKEISAATGAIAKSDASCAAK